MHYKLATLSPMRSRSTPVNAPLIRFIRECTRRRVQVCNRARTCLTFYPRAR